MRLKLRAKTFDRYGQMYDLIVPEILHGFLHVECRILYTVLKTDLICYTAQDIDPGTA